MSKYSDALHEFLESVVKSLEISNIELTKKELKKKVIDYINRFMPNEDPDLLFDEWEPSLRGSHVISDHLLFYSVVRETLRIDKIPTVEQMEYFAEVYGNSLKQNLKQLIRDLTPNDMERLVEYIFQNVSWVTGVVRTPESRDGGLDFVGTFIERNSGLRMKLYGEVKHRVKPIGSRLARDFVGMLSTMGNNRSCCGIYVSTCGFTNDAMKTFKKSGFQIITYDIDKLVTLMIEEKIGIKDFKIEGLVIDEQLWNELKLQ
jgi:restriction endonuclease Mrr